MFDPVGVIRTAPFRGLPQATGFAGGSNSTVVLGSVVTDPVETETTACPLCGDRHFTPFQNGRDLRYGLPGVFHIVCCSNCRHRYLNPRPTVEGIRNYYPPDYAPHHLDTIADQDADLGAAGLKRFLRSVPGLRWAVRWLAESNAEFIPCMPASPKRALELGCSDGRFLQNLVAANWEVEGVEISAAAAAKPREQGLSVHVGTLESAKFADDTFDAVFAWMVIEHLHDPVGTLQEIRRILKSSGWLVFSVPNNASWEPRVFRQYWHAYDLPRHLQHFTTDSILRLLQTTGFENPQIIHQRNAFNITGSLGLLLQHKLPRLGKRLLDFTDNPSIGWILMLTPLAKLLAWIRQAGMLTVIGRPRLD